MCANFVTLKCAYYRSGMVANERYVMDGKHGLFWI